MSESRANQPAEADAGAGSGAGASYRAAGVDYDALDAGKRLAMAKALSTSPLLQARGGLALDASRGEPAFVFEHGGQTLAFVVEGLGTKSIIARHVLEQQGIDRFAGVAYDTVAAILNDLCCVGALPLVAIGGLNLERAKACLAAGADVVSVVTDITLNPDPETRAREWIAATRSP